MDEKEIRGIIEGFVATDARNVIPEIPGLAIYRGAAGGLHGSR